ncbi:UPF0753 protein [Halobellus salinus]|uniref:Probable inorganic carbon transporter subunit DabA n=1 Tax=Halobellus salinus TaxID=931585 RepID=A0A830EM17_9EURY|nr:DUF2309 domain-containing protein [Halobellus salinus]GGJ04059.1 UPF0753 protein [Halobellus salinus]SMP08330.1 hypothetical protein SAMN06265347_10313 [Halobellus salinus]
MSTDPSHATIDDRIDAAAESVGAAWPLHSFVTANPLAGFEDRPFHEAVGEAERILGGDGYPSVATFRRAWADGRIDPELLRAELDAHGYDTDPNASLSAMAAAASTDDPDTESAAADRVDAVVTKWLSAFLDQGQAKWPMPERERGFYDAFRAVARHDSDIPGSDAVAELPDNPVDAIRNALNGHPKDEWEEIIAFHLTALPGWTGVIKQRVADGDAWQSAYPITLRGYLAVRLALVERFDAPIAPTESSDGSGPTASDAPGVPLPGVWLTAWERSYRSALTGVIADASERLAASSDPRDGGRPDAQFVFCIDTRSEIIRRHIEAAGDYETHGYAGFFGIPMRYDGYGSDVTVDACPPIVDAAHHIDDRPATVDSPKRARYDTWSATLETVAGALDDLRSNAATAYSFVETAGAGYGVGLALRTLLPERFYDLLAATDRRTPDAHEFCAPDFDERPGDSTGLPHGLSLDERVEYAATAFELMGFEEFARVVVFAGHASRTANNPFGSALDCGACAGNPGGPSARVLATICNDDAVRAALRERGIDVPEETVFVAGEHNTTTDEVRLYDGTVPDTHTDDIRRLRADLETARAGAATERTGDMGCDVDSGVRETERRAADWAETRPEWGLAGNAGVVIGPRELTAGVDLDGRSFLHSYDWRTDPDGDALAAILTGPMVVTQWINAQYYFATVDTAVYGSGSKVTQNPVGNVGVYQGNGGDLLTGLPLQSVRSADDEPYHQPLRLSTVVHAPVDRVTAVLADHDDLAGLLDNGWLSVTVVDPEQDHHAFHYTGDLEWTPASVSAAATPASEPAAQPADD